jgi:hypothetical protein
MANPSRKAREARKKARKVRGERRKQRREFSYNASGGDEYRIKRFMRRPRQS